MLDFKLRILGSGAAVPSPNRHPAGQILTYNARHYLIDCSEATQLQMRRFHFPFQNLNTIFISHLHGDHVFGLPGLLSTLALNERKIPLQIFCPPRLQDWLVATLNFFAPITFPIEFHTLQNAEPEMIFEDKNLRVTAFPLRHRIPTWGFRFQEKPRPLNIRRDMIDFYKIPISSIPSIKNGNDFHTPDGQIIPNKMLTLPAKPLRSYAYCTDTTPLPHLAEMLQNTTLLYHEATFLSADEKRAAETFHSTAKQAAEIAKIANAKQLLLGHFSARYTDLEPFQTEAQEIFQNTLIARDGDQIDII